MDQETLKEYEAAANIDMDSRSIQHLLATNIPLQINEGTSRNKWMKLFSMKMEFGELKAEAYSSLSMRDTLELNANIDIHIQYIDKCKCKFSYSVERLVDPPLYYAKELDEAIQVSRVIPSRGKSKSYKTLILGNGLR